MGNKCFGKSKHQLLKEEINRTSKLENALLILAETAQSHQIRKEDADKRISELRRKSEDVLKDYKLGRRAKDDVKRQMLTLDADIRYQLSIMQKANTQLVATRQYEDVVRDFSLSFRTSQKMLSVVDDLNSIGLNIKNLDKTSGKVEQAFDRMREAHDQAVDSAEGNTSADYNEMDSDAEERINKQLEDVEVQGTVEALYIPPQPRNNKAVSPHTIAAPPETKEEEEKSRREEEDEELFSQANPYFETS
jgi:hypothetical protein